MTLRELIEHWQATRADAQALRRTDPVPLAQAALELGHPTLACEILRLCGADEHGTPRARYLAALAHARAGASGRALGIALSLLDDPEAAAVRTDTLALTGRIAKDRWSRLPPGEEREHAGKQAVDCYQRAWAASGDVFPGINAATMLLLTGHGAAARELARAVQAAALADTAAEPHWREATLGEAALLLDQPDAAVRHYGAAMQSAGRQVGQVATMRHQLRLLGRALPLPGELQQALAQPRVVVFSGHMVDAPGREVPRFPPALERAVAKRLAERLEALQAGFGYSSAACGADLLFVEAMLERGAEVHVTLPFDRADFLATSVAYAGQRWVERFERAMEQVASIRYGVRERFLGDESLYGYAGRLMQGAALLHARQLAVEPVLLAVLDPAARQLPGGTRDMLDNWQRLGLPLECMDPATLATGAETEVLRQPAPPAPAVEVRAAPLRRQVRTMLFADMVGFSRLAEEDTPSFLVHFLGAIADLVDASTSPPVFVNSWGDGLFMVFHDISEGAAFALRLRDAVARNDWPARGLPAGTSIRIGMHCGPVFEADDPLIGRRNTFGSHVVRAARIEPVAAAGSVYVSEEFAAMLAASGGSGYATDFLGVLPLAKSYGSAPLYRLRRSDEAE